jgi:hypothetical protein
MPEVQFLPWAESTTTITVGPVTHHAMENGAGIAVQQWRYLKRYRTTTNHPIMTIVTITSNRLQNLTGDQKRTW